jgi:hypothetical protein
MHDQYPSGGEFVSAEELGRVMDLGASWLTARGKYMTQGGIVVDEFDGYPVVTGSPEAKAILPEEMLDIFRQPSYEAIIPKRILDVIAPGVSETFGLSDHLELSYFVPCYKMNAEGELTFCTPSLLVSIPKPEGSEITEDCLSITREEDERVYSDRIPTMREGGMGSILGLVLDQQTAEKTGEMSDQLQEHLHAQSFAEQTGLAHINQDELDAIEKVFLGLKIHSKNK